MPPIAVRIDEILALAEQTLDANGAYLVRFSADAVQLPGELRKLWILVLLLALRDRATSVHYHPWRTDGVLTYVIEGRERYELSRPPDEHADAIIETARTLFTAPAGGLLSRLVGIARERTVCSTFFLDGWGDAVASVLWDAVIWSNGERSGVELFRVTPLEPRDPE